MNGNSLFGGNTFLYVLLIVAIYMTYTNMKMAKRNRNSKGYVTCANALFKGDEDAGAQIDSYLEKETVEEYRQKTLIFKLYQELRDGLDTEATLESFTPSAIFENKGAFLPQSVITNSDTFVWICILLNKAGALGKKEFLEAFLEKFAPYREAMQNFVEYRIAEATASLYLSENDDWKDFCRKLLAGEYEGYRYEKRLVGFFKRIAQLLLAESGEEIADEEKEDLSAFAESSVGKMMMNDRGVYPVYAALKEEDPEEENEEDGTENAEAAENGEEAAGEDTEDSAEVTAEAEEEAEDNTEPVPETETPEQEEKGGE